MENARSTGASSGEPGGGGGDGTGNGTQVNEDPCAGGQITNDTTVGGLEENIKSPGAGGGGGGGDSAVSGSLDPQEIRRVIKAHMHSIKYCYEKALKADPAMQGKVGVAFTIGVDGKVSSAKATTTGISAEVGACIEKEFLTFEFAKPSGGPVNVSYPFTFSP